MNLFAYAISNPINSIDPWGLMSEYSKAAIKSIMNNPNISDQQKRELIRKIPKDLPNPQGVNPYISNNFDLPSPDPDAYGCSMEVSTINPFTSDGGGTYGLNIQHTRLEGWQLYTYKTPEDYLSVGFDVGASFTFNYATGSGSWEGPVDVYNGGYGPVTAGFFHTPHDSDEIGYFGYQGGFAIGPPSLGKTRVVTEKW